VSALTLLQSDTLPDSIEEQDAPEVFSMSINRVNLLVVEGVIELRLEDHRKFLPLKHDHDSLLQPLEPLTSTVEVVRASEHRRAFLGIAKLERILRAEDIPSR
jgi:hypothetical protein